MSALSVVYAAVNHNMATDRALATTAGCWLCNWLCGGLDGRADRCELPDVSMEHAVVSSVSCERVFVARPESVAASARGVTGVCCVAPAAAVQGRVRCPWAVVHGAWSDR